MKKKIVALILAFTMVVCLVPSAHAYSILDAYIDFAYQYPEFIDVVVAGGVSESTIIDFLRSLQRNLYLTNRFETITEDNFDDVLIDAVAEVSNSPEFADLQKAIVDAYQDAAYDAVLNHRIHEDLMPLYEAVRSMVFDHDMLSSYDNGSEPYVIDITNISGIEDITVQVGGTYTLPDQTGAMSETKVYLTLDIDWHDQPSTNTSGTFYAEGTVAIPEGYALRDGVSDTVTARIIVSSDPVEDNGDDNDIRRPLYPDRDDPTKDVEVDYLDKPRHVYNFSDVNEKTDLGKAVYALSDIGIINGYVDGTFKPNEKIRRDEFAKIIVTAMENYDLTATASFTDVPADQWAYRYIASAQKAGLINGYVNGTFGPERNISRAEVMTIVYRALNSRNAFKSAYAPVATFNDDNLIAEYAREPIYTLARYGIVGGTVSNVGGAVITTIDPLSDATRGQCVMMVYNALKMMGEIK